MNTGRTHFKKGYTPWNKGKSNPNILGHTHGFKKGSIPWNKGKSHLAKEKNPNWKGGLRSEDYQERRRFQKFCQQLIFQRDNYICQICQQEGGYLQVDHLKSWAKYPELRFELDNCRTLCMACHYYVTFKRKIPAGIIWGHNLSKRKTS